jgi:hypothetical protein
MPKNKKNVVSTNKNAIIRSRVDRTGKLRTETARREDGFNAALSTDVRNDSTRFFIDTEQQTVEFSGREARTLYRLLQNHYEFTGKTNR